MAISLQQWWAFMGMTTLVSLSPGPIMLMCFHNGTRLPAAHQALAMLGASVGNVVLMALSAAGVAVALHYWPALFIWLSLAGGLYLLYMAWRIASAPVQLQPAQGVSSAGAFFSAFTIAISNPKGIVYFAAFLPPFINPQAPVPPQLILLTLSFLAVDLAVMLLYAKAGQQLASRLTGPKPLQRVNQALGLAMAVAAGLMLWRMGANALG